MNHARLVVPILVAASMPAQWTQQAPPLTPGVRAGHGMAEDGQGNVLLFGGVATSPNAPVNTTWRWDGSTWMQLTPAVAPSGRTGIEMVHDVARNRHVVFGGWTAPHWQTLSSQTWEFDGSTWALATPAVSPLAVSGYGACYDLARSRIVLYGGRNTLFWPPHTWEYDGTTWQQVGGVSAPGPLDSPAMCFHAGINRTVMFGGSYPPVSGNDTTWLYDGAAWTPANVTGPRPTVRLGAKMVYDPVRAVCVLFGGWDPVGIAFSDTWEFDGAVWVQVATPTTTAAPRSFHGMAFDGVRRQIVRHGGYLFGLLPPVDETWVFGAQATPFGTGCAGSNGTPALAAVSVPRLGAPWSLTLSGVAVASPFAILAFGPTSIGGAPLGPIGMPGCTAWIGPELLVGIAASGGVASWSGTLPGQAGLVGLHLYAQGLSFDPSVNPAWLTASNAVDGLLGR